MDDCGFATWLFRLLFFVCFSVKPGKCWLSSTSAALTHRAGWKEEEQAKEGKEFFERKKKTGAPASSRFCVSRILRGQATTKTKARVHAAPNSHVHALCSCPQVSFLRCMSCCESSPTSSSVHRRLSGLCWPCGGLGGTSSDEVRLRQACWLCCCMLAVWMMKETPVMANNDLPLDFGNATKPRIERPYATAALRKQFIYGKPEPSPLRFLQRRLIRSSDPCHYGGQVDCVSVVTGVRSHASAQNRQNVGAHGLLSLPRISS
jgi:hypothetical protein